MIERICQNPECGKHFIAQPWRVKRGLAKFCSVSCSLKVIKKGKPFSDEHKHKISEALKGKVMPMKQRRLMSQLNKLGIIGMLGKHHTEEAKMKSAEAQKGKFIPLITRERMSIAQKLKAPISEDAREKLSRAGIRRYSNPLARQEQSRIMKQVMSKPEIRKKLAKASKERCQSPDFRRRQSNIVMRLWQNPEFVATMMKARNVKPTKPEEQMEAILKKYFPEFEYNGDGRLGITLGGLTPDFVNVNGKKDLIEVFGDYYHSPEVLGDRWKGSELGKVMVYNSLGWRCLVIRQHELNELSEGEIVAKIKTFHRRKYERSSTISRF